MPLNFIKESYFYKKYKNPEYTSDGFYSAAFKIMEVVEYEAENRGKDSYRIPDSTYTAINNCVIQALESSFRNRWGEYQNSTSESRDNFREQVGKAIEDLFYKKKRRVRGGCSGLGVYTGGKRECSSKITQEDIYNVVSERAYLVKPPESAVQNEDSFANDDAGGMEMKSLGRRN